MGALARLATGHILNNRLIFFSVKVNAKWPGYGLADHAYT